MSNLTTEAAVRSLLTQGYGATAISKQLGINRSTVYKYKDKISVADTVEDYGLEANEDVQNFIHQLSPIIVNSKPVLDSRTKTVHRYDILNKEFVAVIGDTHFGAECNRTLNIFYQVLEDLKPGTIILNGDTVDLLAVSRYPKDVRYDVTLLQERTAYQKFLYTVREILGPEAKIIETNANHSGNGVEGRWWRFLSERVGPLAALPDVIESLSYKKVFVPDWANVELVDAVELCNGNLHILHGDVVRKHGGQSGRGMMDKWYTSLMMNHTHRMGMTAQRVPGIGTRGDKFLYAYENGCACELKPSYATAANWQNGFSIIKTEGDSYGVEQVSVTAKGAIVNTLNTSYK
jgi:hypothetical protein